MSGTLWTMEMTEHLPASREATWLDRLRSATALLEAVAADWRLLDELPPEDRRRLHTAIAALSAPDRRANRKRAKAAERNRKAATVRNDEAVLGDTGIRTLRRRPAVTTPNVFPPDATAAEVDRPAAAATVSERICYVCKQPYTRVHAFYDQLCPPCADFNFAARTELADLRGSVALLTGGRVKIGYQAGLKLLRSGAHLIVTTRFARNAAARYAQEADFGDWAHRLEIVGLDLRHTPSVETFCRHLAATRERLDFIVNNACQTVRRPPEFYAHMMAGERAALDDVPADVRRLVRDDRPCETPALAPGLVASDGARSAAGLSQVALLAEELLPHGNLFPDGCLDQDLQQVDLRGKNSWRMLLAEVPTVELLEVQLVNAVAPFLINARLKPLMQRVPSRDKHIVNVSAVEGQFYRKFKTTRHPHTNMAKAALKMMTRTPAADYFTHGIHMNSGDTGWVTDEDPVEVAARKTGEPRFPPPLDIVDGAARIVDPIIDGINSGKH